MLLQQLQLLLQVGQEPGGRLRADHRGGMLVEGDHRGGQILLGGHPPDPLDDQPVADVHAVVGADRHRAGAPGRAVAGVVEDLHPAAGYGPVRRRRPDVGSRAGSTGRIRRAGCGSLGLGRWQDHGWLHRAGRAAR